MYRQTLDRIALQTLLKAPDIPDFHLMVGSAESLEPLPILVYKNAKIPVEVVDVMNATKDMTSEEIEMAIANNHLEVNDLNWNLALLGSGLGV